MAQGWCFTATNPRQIVRFTEWELPDNGEAAAIMGASCAKRITHPDLLIITITAPCAHTNRPLRPSLALFHLRSRANLPAGGNELG